MRSLNGTSRPLMPRHCSFKRWSIALTNLKHWPLNISVWLLTDSRSHVKAKEKPWHSKRVLQIRSRLWCSKSCTPNIVPDGQKGNLMIGFVEVTRNSFICWIFIADVEITTKANNVRTRRPYEKDIYRILKTFQDNIVSHRQLQDD